MTDITTANKEQFFARLEADIPGNEWIDELGQIENLFISAKEIELLHLFIFLLILINLFN